MKNFNDLDSKSYTTLRQTFIELMEEKRVAVYDDGAGIPTIGIGYNLRDELVAESVITSMGVNPSAAMFDDNPTARATESDFVDQLRNACANNALNVGQLIDELNRIMAARYSNPELDAIYGTGVNNERKQSFTYASVDDVAMLAPFNQGVSRYERRVDAWVGGAGIIPNSYERLAFLSMAYRGDVNATVAPSMKRAFDQGNRAEVWYEVRYNTVGVRTPEALRRGVAKRKYIESEMIGLFSPGFMLVEKEVIDALKMYSRYRERILDYDADELKGESARTLANADDNFVPFLLGGGISDIQGELNPAITWIKEHGYDELQGELLSLIQGLDGEFILGDHTNGVIDDVLGSLSGSEHPANKSDLIMGLSGNDSIFSQGGNDVVFGGAGNDVVYGGSGDDHIYGGIGNDTLAGEGGRDRLIGGAGNDELIGGDEDDLLVGGIDDDILLGGDGFDIYDLSEDPSGSDIVFDSDGRGFIFLDGMAIGVLYETAPGYCVNNNFAVSYTEGSGDITITSLSTGKTIAVSGWQNGSLGILISVEPPETPPGNYADPLSLDLNGDGTINTLPLRAGVQFDLDNNGFAETTSWVAPVDGLLVLDLNANNKIDGGHELFGTDTRLPDGRLAANGFEALVQYDTNTDGVIDNRDAVFSNLRIWQDANSNGITDSGELSTLTSRSIKSINTTYISNISTDVNGIQHREESRFQYTNNTSGVTQTLWFEVDRQITVPTNEISISPEIQALPDAKGYGNVYRLRQAMALDATGALQSKVEAFVAETDIATKKSLINEILILWAGQKNTRSGSRGNFMDAQQLGVLEAFWGMPSPHTIPDARYSAELSVAYQQLQNSIYTQMVAPQYADLLSAISVKAIDGKATVDFSTVAIQIANLFGTENPQAKHQLDGFMEVLKGLDSYNSKSQYSPDHFMNALLPEIRKLPLDIQNEFFGVVNWDNGAIKGTDGDDTLYSLNKDDLILGGKGDDSYMIYRGNGADVISDSGGNDKVVFGDEILPEQVSLYRSFDSLVIKLDSGEQIDIAGMFRNPASASIYNIKDGRIAAFVEGLSSGWIARAEKLVEEYYGLIGGGDLTLEFLEGEPGGAAASVVVGYYSTDPSAKSVLQTFKVELGDFDFNSLTLKNGTYDIDRVVAHEMVHSIMANNMFILGLPGWFVEGTAEFIHGADERVNADLPSISTQESFNSYFSGVSSVESPYYSVSYIAVKYLDDCIRSNGGNGVKDVFEYLKNGKTLDQALTLVSNEYPAIISLWNNLASFESNFRSVGFTVKDTLLNLNDGDTGSIAGSDYGNPVLNGKDVLPDGAPVASRRTNLIIPDIYIDSSLPPVDTSIERIEFSDGTSWNLAEILARVIDSPESAATKYGYDYDDIMLGDARDDMLRGMEGNDLLSGKEGNDLLIGDEGNDKLNGGVGNDSLIGGVGNDLYVYSLGDGDDTIKDVSGYDSIEISGVWIDSVNFQCAQEGTLILLMPDGGSITISNAINMLTGQPSENAVETINGRGWDYIRNRVLQVSGITNVIYGFGSDDWISDGGTNNASIYGGGGNDLIFGGRGSDLIYGGAGADSIHGGEGSDTLSGGDGSDFFIYEYAGGHDVIVDATPDDTLEIHEGDIVVPYVDELDLIFAISTGGTITLKNAANADGTLIRENMVGKVLSVEGLWDFDDLANLPLTNPGFGRIYYGSDDVDQLMGTTNDDTLLGGAGDDEYYFEKNSGNDKIFDSEGKSFIKFRGGINSQNVIVRRNSDDFIVVKYSETSSVAIDEADANFQIDFEDGDVWDLNFIRSLAVTGSEFNDALIGSNRNDYLTGNNGDDLLSGGRGGSDTFVGGLGSDTLSGGSEDDVYIYKLGDGADVISDRYGSDTLELIDVAPENVAMRKLNGNLHIEINGSHAIVVESMFNRYYPNASYADTGSIEFIRFGSGEEWNFNDIVGHLNDPDPIPQKPTATISADGRFVTGVGSAGSIVVVENPVHNYEITSITIQNANGEYSIYLPSPLLNGEIISVSARNINGIESEAVVLVAPDKTAPPIPTASFDATGLVITGTAETGSTVIVKNEAGTELKTAVADATTGAYTITLADALINKETVSVTAKDAAGNISAIKAIAAPDKTPPAAPTASFDAAGKVITGFAEAGSTVIVKNANGTQLKTATANATTGAYTITLTTALINKETVTVTAKDSAGNISAGLPIIAPDKTAPAIPTASFDTAGKVITGVAEAGSTVIVKNSAGTELKTTIADATTGAYTITLTDALINKETVSVTAKDAAGNISAIKAIVAPDKTPPAAPTASFDAAGKVITGFAEAGSTVIVKNASGTQLKTATANATTGAYTITLTTALINKETVTVTAKDSAGNISAGLPIIAPDKTAPAIPTASFDTAGKVITGVAEAGSTVIVKNSEGTELKTAVADATTGAYNITLTTALINKETVNVTAKDTAGNISAIKAIVAPDKTPPAAPTASINAARKIITGVAEAGSVVEVKNTFGSILGSITANATTGAYTITLATALTINQTVNVTAKDAAGNISPIKPLVATGTAKIAFELAALTTELNTYSTVVAHAAEMKFASEVRGFADPTLVGVRDDSAVTVIPGNLEEYVSGASRVNTLIHAMAAFEPTVGVDASKRAAYADQHNVVIAVVS